MTSIPNPVDMTAGELIIELRAIGPGQRGDELATELRRRTATTSDGAGAISEHSSEQRTNSRPVGVALMAAGMMVAVYSLVLGLPILVSWGTTDPYAYPPDWLFTVLGVAVIALGILAAVLAVSLIVAGVRAWQIKRGGL